MFDFLKNPIIKRLIASGVRAALVAAGTWLVTKQIASSAEVASLVDDLTPILVALIWSAWEASQANKKAQAMIEAAVKRSERQD